MIILLVVGVFMTAGFVWLLRVTSGIESSFGPGAQFRQFLNNAIGKIFPSNLIGYEILLPFIFSWLALFAAVAVHELGHLLAGVATRFRLLYVQLGRVQIRPPFHVKWRRKGLPGATGFTAMVPADARKLRLRALIMLFGGPAANLITVLPLAFLPSHHSLFASWFIVISVAVGLLNLLPFRSMAVISDGKRILMLLRNSRQGERWLALLQLVNDLRSGVDHEQLNPEFVAIATAVQDDSPDTVSAHTIAFSAAFEKHDDPEAARLLEICLRHSGCVGPALREAAFLNAAIFQAERRKHADLAEQWLTELPAKSLFPQSRLNAQGAILQTRGDIPGALKKLDESEAMVLRLPPSPRREASLRSLQKWRAELQAMQSPAVEATHSLS